MFKRFLLLSMVALAALANGCGDTEHIQAVNYYTNVIGNGLSGQVGNVTVQTTLQAQVLGQTVSVVESTTVPTVVDQFRITGYGADGVAVYGPTLVAKAASTTLQSVPVEVRTLGVELLVDGLSIGGATVPITVTNGQNTTVSNLTFVITAGGSGATGPAGPAGPSGPSGPSGPAGPDGSVATAYGSFATTGENQDIGGEGPSVDFGLTVAAENVEYLSEFFLSRYRVGQAGDYLITYSLRFDGFGGEGREFAFEVYSDGEDFPERQSVTFFELGDAINSFQSISFVVSLDANESVALFGTGPSRSINSGTMTIIRLGPSTNTPPPSSLPSGNPPA